MGRAGVEEARKKVLWVAEHFGRRLGELTKGCIRILEDVARNLESLTPEEAVEEIKKCLKWKKNRRKSHITSLIGEVRYLLDERPDIMEVRESPERFIGFFLERGISVEVRKGEETWLFLRYGEASADVWVMDMVGTLKIHFLLGDNKKEVEFLLRAVIDFACTIKRYPDSSGRTTPDVAVDSRADHTSRVGRELASKLAENPKTELGENYIIHPEKHCKTKQT